jgi:hypothetical protein
MSFLLCDLPVSAVPYLLLRRIQRSAIVVSTLREESSFFLLPSSFFLLPSSV